MYKQLITSAYGADAIFFTIIENLPIFQAQSN